MQPLAPSFRQSRETARSTRINDTCASPSPALDVSLSLSLFRSFFLSLCLVFHGETLQRHLPIAVSHDKMGSTRALRTWNGEVIGRDDDMCIWNTQS